MADPLATATGDLRLSDEKLLRDIAAIRRRLLQEMRTLEEQAKVNIGVTVDLSKVRAEIRRELAVLQRTAAAGGITVPVDADTAPMAREIAGVKAAAEAVGIDIPVKLDLATARGDIAQLVAGLNAFDTIKLQADLRTDQIEEANAALLRLAAIAKSVESDTIIIDPIVRDAGARAELARISTLITAVSGQPVDIDVDVDAATALSQLSTVTAAVAALDGRDIDIQFDVNGIASAAAQIEAVDAVADKAASNNGGIGRLVSRLGFLAVGGVAAIGAAGAAITVMGVQSAAALEGTIKSFENILGSAEQADVLFKELQAFAIPSPFDTQTLANTARQLLAIGITAEEVVPTVKDLGAIVALLGNSSPEAFGRLTLALGQIRTSVKPLTQDLRQITSTLPGFNTEMQLAEGVAERFGVSFQEAQEKIKDGAITGEDAVDILLERMQEFPGVAGSIEAAAETLQGKLSAFGDTIQLNLISAFSGVSTLVADALGPLEGQVDIALKAIGPALARSFEGLIPQILPLVDDLGLALAPAFEGLFTGLGSALEGVVPVITQLLPLMGRVLPEIGRIIAELGPAVAQTGTTLASILVPGLTALADVLEIIPVPVLTSMVTAFVAFKAAQGVAGTITSITASFSRFSAVLPGTAKAASEAGAAVETTTTSMDTAGGAVKKFSSAAVVGSAAIVGAISGIGFAADDTAGKVTSFVSAVGSAAAGFAAGGPIGLGLAVGATAIGAIVGQLQAGKREAEEFQATVETLADTIRTEFGEAFGITEAQKLTAEDVIDTESFDEFLSQQLDTDFMEELLSGLPNGVRINRDELKELLAGTDADIAAFLDSLYVYEGGLANRIVNVEDVARIAGRLDEIDRVVSPVLDSLRTRAEFDADQTGKSYKTMADAYAANQRYMAGVAKERQQLLDDEAKSVKDLEEAYEEALKGVEAATKLVSTAFSGLDKNLSLTVARQNIETDIAGISSALLGLVDSDGFKKAQEEAKRLIEDINDQRDTIADLRADVAREQADAQTEADILDARIEAARAAGATVGAAALERERALVFQDAEKAQRNLDDALRELDELEARLGGIDLSNPGGLLDIVKQQAAEAGIGLYQFILAAPTEESKQLFQDTLAPTINGILSQAQGIFETQGATAAQLFLASASQDLTNQLTAGGLDPAIAQQLVDNLIQPDLLSTKMQEAVEAAITAANIAAAAGIEVPVNVNVVISERDRQILEALQVESAGRNQRVSANGGGIPFADGGLLFFRNGGVRENHTAHMAPAGAWRVFAEPETGGEAYIPLGVRKRRQSEKVLSQVAEMFGLALSRRDPVSADVAHGSRGGRPLVPSAAARQAVSRSMDRSVNVEQITVNEAKNAHKTATRIVSQLSDLGAGRIDWDEEF